MIGRIHGLPVKSARDLGQQRSDLLVHRGAAIPHSGQGRVHRRWLQWFLPASGRCIGRLVKLGLCHHRAYERARTGPTLGSHKMLRVSGLWAQGLSRMMSTTA
jgi:hypothetical protein